MTSNAGTIPQREQSATRLATSWRVAAALLLLCATAACGPRAAREGADDSTSAPAQAPATPIAWKFDAPPTWDDRVLVVDDPTGEAKLAKEGVRSARLFNYRPRDTTIVSQTLLGIWVYDSAAWARVQAEDGPPQGEEVARSAGVVFVAGLPQSNPFAPKSVDSVEFERRGVTIEQVKRAFHVVR